MKKNESSIGALLIAFGLIVVLILVANIKFDFPFSTRKPTNTPSVIVSPEIVTAATPTPTATLTPSSPGRLEITYPLEMTVEQSGVVAVEIIVDRRWIDVGVHPPHVTGIIYIQTSSQDGEQGRIEDTIGLYPVMSAELIAPNFDILHGDTDTRRAITTTFGAAWTWDIVARKPGPQRITINIFGETSIDGEQRVILEKSTSQNISVSEKPLSKRLLDGDFNNLGILVGAAGPLGLIVAILKIRGTDRASRKLKERIEGLEAKLEELRKSLEERISLEPSIEDEVAYWLIPAKSGDGQTAPEAILASIGKERVYEIGGKTSWKGLPKPGDWVCFYAAGKGVVAHAKVISGPERQDDRVRHSPKHSWGFRLDRVELYLDEPLALDAVVRKRLDCLRHRDLEKPWGWFVREIREITNHDFTILTRRKAKS